MLRLYCILRFISKFYDNCSLYTLLRSEICDHFISSSSSTPGGIGSDPTEIPIFHRDGSERNILWNASTLYSQDGLTPIATIAQGRDVTDERRLEQEKSSALQQIQENLAYLAVLNDEIRNPLTIILTYAELISDAKIFDLIVNQAERIDMIVNQLDIRWVESEKVLNAIRKHYQINTVKFSEKKSIHTTNSVLKINPGNKKKIEYHNNAKFIKSLQDQLLIILDSIDALVYVADMDTYEILFINKPGMEEFGDVIGEKCFKTLQNQESPCSFCTNNYLVDSSGPTGVFRWEYKNVKNGRWYDCRDRAVRWSDGRLVRLEVASDITGRKQEQEHLKELTRQLAESEAKYHSLIDNSQDIIYTINPEGRFTYVSPSWSHLLGRPVVQVIGKLFTDYIHPEDVEAVQYFIKNVFDKNPQSLSVEYRIHHLNGSLRWHTLTAVAIFNKKGEIQGAEGTAKDITEWKHAQTALVESEERYKKLVNNIPDYILVHRNGTILFVNDAAASVIGYSPEELIGTHLLRYLSPESRNMVIEMMQKRFEGNTLPTYEITIFPKNGKQRITEVQGVLIQYEGLPASLNVLTDITERKRVFDELHESEEKFRNIFDFINDGLHIHEVDSDGKPGKFIEVNRVACQMLQYNREELLQHGPLDFVTNYHSRPLKDIIDELSSTGHVIFETEHVRRDGTIIPVEINAHLIFLQGREVCISAIRDISLRKLAEESVIASEKKFRELFEHANVGIAIAQKGMLRLVNPQMEKLTGYIKDELLSNPISFFIHPDDTEMVLEKHQKREIGEDVPSAYSFRLSKKNGTIAWVEINAVFIDWEEQPATLFFLIDISMRKKAEEELQDAYEMFSQYMFHSPIYTYIKSVTPHESRVLHASENFADMIGIRGSEMVGKSMEDLFPVEFAENITQNDWDVVSQKEVLTIDEQLNDRLYITIKFPIIQKNKTLLAGYTIDVTEMKQAEDALTESNKKLRLLTSLTRHDIFNQLSAVHLFLDLAKKHQDPVRLNDNIVHAEEAAARIESIIGFTREYENFGVTSSIWQCIHELIQSAQKEVLLNEVTIRISIPETLEIFADPIIRKVFTTLMENALRHGGGITSINFEHTIRNRAMVIICSDDGIGIPDRKKGHIFNHGYGKHTGIGLFLAKEILSITGLSIRECGVKGEGARFEIFIPAGKWRDTL